MVLGNIRTAMKRLAATHLTPEFGTKEQFFMVSSGGGLGK